jgi:Ca-activated chloride channel family protein
MPSLRQLRHIFTAFLLFAGAASAQQDLRIAPSVDRNIAPRLVITGPVEQPVVLQSVTIGVDIVGGQAQTEVQLVFRNPNRRVLEGELQFPLLDGQQIAGFALDVEGRMRDAVPVEKDKGRQVFEDIVRRGVDPGLLEATQGNNYKLRVYPLPAQGTRSVRLRIIEALAPRAGERVYRLALAYGTVPHFSLAIRARGLSAAPTVAWRNPDEIRFVRDADGYSARIERNDFIASGFLEATARQSGASAWAGEFGGARYFFAELPVRATALPRRLPKAVALVWDSSASGAQRDHGREFALLDTYFGRMGDGVVRLQRVRETVSAPEEFRISGGQWRALRTALEQTVYDGATNLGALAPLAGTEETLLFSDGLSNFGDPLSPKLAGRVFAISAAARANAPLLRFLAEASGGRFIDLLADSRAQAADKLLKAGPRLRHVDADGAREVVAASPYPNAGYLSFAGILEGNASRLSIAIEMPNGAIRNETLRVRTQNGAGDLPARLWARLRVDALEGEYDLHRAEIRRLGKAFAMVTRETSLIVLERIEDYARNEILPPAELRDAYERLVASAAQRRTADRQQHLERIVRLFQEKQAWWNRSFPKDARPAAKDEQKPAAGAAMDMLARSVREESGQLLQRRDAPAAAAAPAPAKSEARAKSLAAAAAAPAEISIQLKRWTPDAAYFRRLQQAAARDLYRVYLDERQENAASTAFYLDVADLFFERGERVLGIRILSNLAEMDLENRHVLRILGYRLMQAAEPGLAIPVFKRVLQLSPEEPQSYRDLGLAYAATGQLQLAVDMLHEVVVRPWHGRFPEIELITLAEINAIVARAKEKPDTSRIDPRLLQNLPLDLRVVLSWDADNTDIDLWVTDPNGEKAYYGNRLTYQGGRMSQDFTGGYGPEEFSLKNAKPGRYRVEAQFYGNRQQIVAGATTLQLRLATRFGTPAESEKIVTLRLKGQSEVVMVGEFEVK